MGFQGVWFIRRAEALIDSAAACSLLISTDLPGNVVATRGTYARSATTGRRTMRFDFPATVQGRLVQFKLTASGVVKLYGLRYEARAPGAEWQWFAVAVPETPDGWQESPLPIPETPEGWQESPLPIQETQIVPGWVDLPLDE